MTSGERPGGQTTHETEWQGDVFSRIDTGEGRNERQPGRSEVETIVCERGGPFIMVESRDAEDYTAQEPARRLRSSLYMHGFDPAEPEESMRRAFGSLHDYLRDQREATQEDHGYMASALRFFGSAEEGLHAVFGIVGNDQIYLQRPQGEDGRHVISRAVTPSPHGYDRYLTGEEGDASGMQGLATGVIDLHPGDRLIIVSNAVETMVGEQLKEQVIEVDENLNVAMRQLVHAGPASRQDKIALGIQVGERQSQEGSEGVDSLGSMMTENHHDEERSLMERLGLAGLAARLKARSNRRAAERQRQAEAARAASATQPAVPAAVPEPGRRRWAPSDVIHPASERTVVAEDVVTEPSQVPLPPRKTGRFAGLRNGVSDYRRNLRMAIHEKDPEGNRRNLGRAALYGTAGYAAFKAWDHERRQRWYADQRNHPRYANSAMTEVEINEDIKRRHARNVGVMVVGLAAAIIAYRMAFDLGDGRDKGIDLWPFGNGDKGQGDGRGFDINWSNRSPFLNDDPTVPHWDKSGGMDLLPAWVDGDPMDPFHWPWTPNTHYHYVPGGGAIAHPGGHTGGGTGSGTTGTGGGTGGTQTPPPPPPPPPAPSMPPAPVGDQPAQAIYVEPGSGFDREIQEYAASKGHQISDPQAFRIYSEGRANFGDNGLIVGEPTYVSPSGDLRIGGVGNANLTAQMQQLIDRDLANMPS